MKIGGIKKMEKIPYEQVCKLFELKGYKIIGQYVKEKLKSIVFGINIYLF